MEAIGNAGSAIVMLSKDGVVLIGEKKVISKLLQTSASSEKVYKIDDHMACVVARILSNANILINTGRIIRMISDDITTEEAVQLSFKVLGKTMDNTSLTPEKLELAERREVYQQLLGDMEGAHPTGNNLHVLKEELQMEQEL
ncbi:Proteasome subunit alpha type-4 [Capsicum annuum]|nr:Proteasome subunit alpha type-4 [Capsicum annuum]